MKKTKGEELEVSLHTEVRVREPNQTKNGSYLVAHTVKKIDLYVVNFIKEPISPNM